MSTRRWCPRCGKRGCESRVVRKFSTQGGTAMVLRTWSHLDYHGGDPKDCQEVRTAERDRELGAWGKAA